VRSAIAGRVRQARPRAAFPIAARARAARTGSPRFARAASARRRPGVSSPRIIPRARARVRKRWSRCQARAPAR